MHITNEWNSKSLHQNRLTFNCISHEFPELPSQPKKADTFKHQSSEWEADSTLPVIARSTCGTRDELENYRPINLNSIWRKKQKTCGMAEITTLKEIVTLLPRAGSMSPQHQNQVRMGTLDFQNVDSGILRLPKTDLLDKKSITLGNSFQVSQTHSNHHSMGTEKCNSWRQTKMLNTN